MPAHAATSGILLSGNFSGSGAIDLAGINRKQQPAGLIAQIGTSIDDFFVSEVHADELMRIACPDDIDCCTSIEGDTITYYLTIGDNDCLSFPAPLAGVARYTDRHGRLFTLEVVEKDQDSIRIKVTLIGEDEPYTTTLALNRSEDVCKCEEHSI
ncbi:MAG: hypothetical protein COA36_12590 [Desulfotalea sp.]|nr:MAG: hypothetical protein COA36_12590 [Desulfotalea sp.]